MPTRSILRIVAAAASACLLSLSVGRQEARAFDVSGFHFDDFHATPSSPPESRGSSRDRDDDPAPRVKESFHAFTPDPDGSGILLLFSGSVEMTESGSGKTTSMSQGEMVAFDAKGRVTDPKPIDGRTKLLSAESAASALVLLRTAAALVEGDDREFLVQQAGFVMLGVPVPIVPPASSGVSSEDAHRFVALHKDVGERLADLEKIRRERDELADRKLVLAKEAEALKSDPEPSAAQERLRSLDAQERDLEARERDAEAALQEAWKARESIIGSASKPTDIFKRSR